MGASGVIVMTGTRYTIPHTIPHTAHKVPSQKKAGRVLLPFLLLEPVVGVEPTTCCLRNSFPGWTELPQPAPSALECERSSCKRDWMRPEGTTIYIHIYIHPSAQHDPLMKRHLWLALG